ncbi:aminotransferase class I/II-fold pyridoxal phosphate-dependent enzyme [Pantoea ananatis]|uniref:aminotransferase class I/II-fold pyridoxal phosphate-dependent enzyme n=1 Tax=Pantoea ananas TaxID=553 RepID=UPI0023B156F7|nr:aminotransferase class I/II-fold pyridoxal phosphate-dependent enzyme [Pantoea ananatis]
MLTIIPQCSESEAVRRRELEAVMLLAQSDMADSLAAVASFEAALAGFLGFTACVTTSSDTAALSVMAGAMGLMPGDEVLISPDVSAWVAAALVHDGMKLTLIDYAPSTLHIDAVKLKENLTDRSRLVILSSHFSFPEHEAALQDLCRLHSLIPVVEVTASCLADPERMTRVAGFDIALVSLREGRGTLSTGEGGALFYRRDDWARKAKSFSQFSDLDGVHQGVNHKLSGIQCALGQIRLTVLAETVIAVPDQWKQHCEWCEQFKITGFAQHERYLPSGWIIEKHAAAAHEVPCKPLPVLTGFPASYSSALPEAQKMCQKWALLPLSVGGAA